MRKCGRCGFSIALSKLYQWNENGIITYQRAPGFRGAMYYSDLFDHLFHQIEERLGFSVSRSIFEAQRAASRVAIEDLLELAPSWLRNTYAFKHLANYLFCRLSIWIGAGYSRSLGYRSGDWGEAIVRNPYNRELMAAIILGAFESLDDCAYVHEWKKLGDDDVISITATKGRPADSEWTAIPPGKVREGGRELPRCPKCGAPDALSSLVWHDKEGIVVDSRIGVRVNFLDAYANRAVFRELERELGDSVSPLVLEAVKSFALPHLEKLPGIRPEGRNGRAAAWKVFSEEAAFMLPAWGHGMPVKIVHEGGKTMITLDNPFEERLIAGYLVAGYQVVEGRECAIKWDFPEPGRVVYTISGV